MSGGFSSNAYAQESRPAPFTCWRCKRPGHFACFCRAPIPQIQLDLGAHIEKITPKSKDITPFEAIVDVDISVEADTFCDNVYSNIVFKTYSDSSSDSLNQYDASENVKNRLSKNVEFWQEIGASPWVIKVFKEGYAIPLLEIPPKVFFKNNKSALKHSDFVSSEILNLSNLGCVKEIRKDEAYVISPLSVVYNAPSLDLFWILVI